MIAGIGQEDASRLHRTEGAAQRSRVQEIAAKNEDSVTARCVTEWRVYLVH